MSELIYCTYLTVYTGNKLPPFYIGSTSIDKINKGYRGSVKSQIYMAIWKQELSDHPDLFKTIILTKHETREEAMEREVSFHESFSVARNPMYINMAHANGKFLNTGPHTPETKAKIAVAKTGKKHTPETKAKIAVAKTGKKHTPEHIANNAAAHTGKKHTPESIDKMTGQKRSPEARTKMSVAQTGKKRSPEHIANHAAAITGKKRGPNKKTL